MSARPVVEAPRQSRAGLLSPSTWGRSRTLRRFVTPVAVLGLWHLASTWPLVDPSFVPPPAKDPRRELRGVRPDHSGNRDEDHEPPTAEEVIKYLWDAVEESRSQLVLREGRPHLIPMPMNDGSLTIAMS